MSLSDISGHFRWRIEAAREQQIKELDLSKGFGDNSDEKLSSIPSEVFQLEHLENLNLSGNQIVEVPTGIKRLRNLKALNLESNELTSIPSEVFQLEHLENLDLSDNQIVEVPTGIERLRNLKTLNLYRNKMTSLPEEIGRLSNLTTLAAFGNNIIYFPETLGELPSLTTLLLSTDRENPAQLPSWLPHLTTITKVALFYFGFIDFPDWLVRWTSLRELNLSGNLLSKIPEWIDALEELTVLWLAGNQLTGLPVNVSNLHKLGGLSLWENKVSDFPLPVLSLHNLRRLILGNNYLTVIPSSISQLRQLEILDLSYNQLTDLPESVYLLSELKDLEVSSRSFFLGRPAESRGNQITKISSRILQLEKLENLNIADNPLEVPPPEIAGKGLEAIREYFRQLTAAGTDHLYEAKLLIVGEGGAGKTTLVKKIVDPVYELREEDSTRGIDVVPWQFPLDNGRTFQVNIWDFGGQEIYHATHQFFLTKRSLYVLVADTRREDTDFYYWLNVAELLSDGSPILIIKNEKQDRHREINERALRGRFGNLKETLATNLATCRGLDKVMDEIRHQIAQLPHVGTPLPATWVRVREALEQDPRNYISLEDYLSICERHGFAGAKARLQLSEYLHDLGVCLHFQGEPLLKKMVILRPKWGTDAVYKVLDNARVIRNLGRFTRADLEHIWDEPEYAAVHDELLQLMKKFKLCYPLSDASGTYIAPQLLSASQPDFLWEETDNLLLRYSYKFMPKGILTQFIVVMYAFIAEHRLVWKSGVVLSKDKALAEVKEHYDRREIRIRVMGKHRKDLLVIAMHELDKIHLSYPRLEYSKLVPCNCSVCKTNPEPNFYEFGVLRKFVEDRKRIQCQRSYEMVDVLGLVDDIVGREQLIPIEDRTKGVFAEEPRSPQFLFQGAVDKVVVQTTSGGESTLHLEERRDDKMVKPSKGAVKARSAWANGSFYLFTFVIVLAALGLLARTVPWYVLPVVLIAGAIFVPLVGALQLRMDEQLSQKSFLELMKLVIRQLPLIRRSSEQQNK